MSAVQGDRQDPAEGKAEQVWAATVNNVDEPGQCVPGQSVVHLGLGQAQYAP
jgi:hypothetical protein